MKKYLRYLTVIVVVTIAICGVVGIAFFEYYANRFPVNTWINGIYCTGKTVDEVNSELQQKYEASVVCITDANRASWEISTDNVAITPNYGESLKKLLSDIEKTVQSGNEQNKIDIQIEPDYFNYEEVLVANWMETLDFVVEEDRRETGVTIQYQDGEYFLCDGNAKRLSKDKLHQVLCQSVKNGCFQIDLDEYDVYRELQDSDADIVVRKLWEKAGDFVGCGIVYDMGAETLAISEDEILSFLSKKISTNENGEVQIVEFLLDENGNFVIEEAAVQAWVEEHLAPYNTVGTICRFQSTRGDVIEVPYVKYGTEINLEAEKEYLLSALNAQRTQEMVRIPTYFQQGYVRGLNDIGGTYIEIDMSQQKMYYYKDFALLLESDVVTGDVRDDMETPEGINYIYNKQRNRTLRGPGYASFVKYWMPVIGGVGIHDAAWRSSFGGEIYLKNGSHGCINTPSDVMDDFYEAINVGTPVIMFY